MFERHSAPATDANETVFPTHMTHYEEEMVRLREALLTMSNRAGAATRQAIQALIDRNDDLARQVIDGDGAIDQLEIEIDALAIHLLAKAPLATDLRFITVAMKTSQNLERVGDEAACIAWRAIELNREPQLKPYIDLPRMAAMSCAMLGDAIAAFFERSPQLARQVLPRDREVDELNRQLHRELSSFMVEQPANISRSLNLMAVARRLERIGDHATNIAEEVVFLHEGRDIRHLG